MSNQPNPKPNASRQLNFRSRPIFLLKLLFYILAQLYLLVTCASAATFLPAGVTTATLYFHLAQATLTPTAANCPKVASVNLYAYMPNATATPIITASEADPYAPWPGDCIPVSSSTKYTMEPKGSCISIYSINNVLGATITINNPNTTTSGLETTQSLTVTCTNNKRKKSTSKDPQITLQGSGGNSCCENKSCPYICRLPGQPLFWLFKKPWNIDSR